MNVIWNNSFRKIFQCCGRESVSSLFYYCKTLPLSYVIDRRKNLFMKKIQTCDNSVVWAVSTLNESTGKIMSKFQSLSSSSSKIKEQMWSHFVDSQSVMVKSVVNNTLHTFL